MTYAEMTYAEMTLAELNDACDRWHQKMLEARAKIRAGRLTLGDEELLALYQVVGEAQAHMNVIQPHRTRLFAQAEYDASQEAQRMRGRLSQEDYKALLQKVGVAFIEPETQVHSTE